MTSSTSICQSNSHEDESRILHLYWFFLCWLYGRKYGGLSTVKLHLIIFYIEIKILTEGGLEHNKTK